MNIRVIYDAKDGQWVGLESLMDNGKILRYVPIEGIEAPVRGEGVGE